jgi:hypothetical protein
MKRILMVLALSLFAAGTLAEEPKGIKKAGEGIEKGEAAAGRGIKKAAKHPANAITKAGNWIGKKTGNKGRKKREKAGN